MGEVGGTWGQLVETGRESRRDWYPIFPYFFPQLFHPNLPQSLPNLLQKMGQRGENLVKSRGRSEEKVGRMGRVVNLREILPSAPKRLLLWVEKMNNVTRRQFVILCHWYQPHCLPFAPVEPTLQIFPPHCISKWFLLCSCWWRDTPTILNWITLNV